MVNLISPIKDGNESFAKENDKERGSLCNTECKFGDKRTDLGHAVCAQPRGNLRITDHGPNMTQHTDSKF